MARRADAGGIIPIAGVVSSLALLGAASASWVDQPATRVIGDVAVTEIRATPGFEVSPLMVVAALGGLLCAVLLLLARTAGRRIVSLLATVAGVCAVVAVGVGLARLSGSDGEPTVAPWFAALASAGMLVAGLTGFGRPGRRMPARYDVDAPSDDTEWEIASDPAADDGADTTSYPERA